ncbi:MAG: 2Fe-2S iron-sulfur cluster-binding protein [Clostridia bacterium]|nr:2Fe-2S iron-sulfur cluster-binding protein [Clostridia bacterium]
MGHLFDIFAPHPYASPRILGPGMSALSPEDNRETEKHHQLLALAQEGGRELPYWIGEKGWEIQDEAALLADCFGHEGADQCGYCNPSMALTAYAMKKELGNPTDEEIRAYLVGNLCRCSGYVAQHRAIRAYLEVK